jgi:hypothetical protein
MDELDKWGEQLSVRMVSEVFIGKCFNKTFKFIDYKICNSLAYVTVNYCMCSGEIISSDTIVVPYIDKALDIIDKHDIPGDSAYPYLSSLYRKYRTIKGMSSFVKEFEKIKIDTK